MSHNDQSTNLILAQMKATIIILPPFLHSCKKNVPAALNTNAPPRQTTTATSKNKNNDTSSTGSHANSSSGGSCYHREHQHKNYGKHAPKSSTATTSTRTSQEGKQQLKVEVEVEVEVVEKGNSNNAGVEVELNNSSSITSSRYGRQHQHRKYFHTHCVSWLAKQQQQLQEQQEAEYQQQQQNIIPTMQQPSAIYDSQLTTATTSSSSSVIGTTTTNAKPTRRRKSIKLSSLQRSGGGGDYQINNNDVDVDTDQMTNALKTTTRTNYCLADNFKLRNSQLVMPTEGEANDVAENEENEASRLVEVAENNVAANDSKKMTCSDMLSLSRSRQITATTRWTTSLAEATATNKNNNKYDNDNISQTTTLECRCFKDNGDIIEGTFNEKTEGNSGDSSSKRMNDEKLLPRRTIKTAATTTTTTIDEQQQQQRQILLSWQRMSLAAKASAAFRSSQLMKTIALSSKFSLGLMLLMMLTSSANCWAGRQDVPTNCTFPARWEGSWFLSGYQQSIHIKGSQFSYRGKCAASDGNKYLIVDEKGCHRCLVIYEKHKNVLQYKESECEGDSMYMHQSNPSAMAMRSVLKQSDHRGGAHPNSNGHSRLSSSDQYIMRSNDDMNDYFCKGRETLQNLCDQIPGDALLYSLFRESAEPVKCPLKGPFVFTYNRGHGECKNPVSNIESCTEESRLLLSFQACPDVQGTESTVEELTCLATWKDGNSRYLVGLVSHHHAISNEERYRCFVYEKISSIIGGPSIDTSKDAEYKLAQSGDATCNGLDSAEVGSRIMSLRKPPLAERCDFPVWFKGPRHWHALMGNAVYNYHSNEGSVHIIKPNGYMETRALCEQINKQTSTEMMAVVHYTTGCQSGFMCMMFYRRDTHVIEIQTGKQASRLEDACAPDHFDINRMPYITLLASNPDPQICPMEGLYSLRGAIGPPYLTTRHKRNHNNKAHGGHGHHHLSQSEPGVSGGGNGNGFTHKRHGTLSFRNSDKIEQGSWHANTRGLPVRSRRDAISTTIAPPAYHTHLNVNGNSSTVDVASNKEMALHNGTTTTTSSSNNAPATTISTANVTSVAFLSTNSITGRQRRRRDAPGCVTNYKAQRQLWIGCTEPNVIDVRPLCNDDGDEEYSCHGSWTENGTVYIITRHKGTKHGVCISYRPTEGTSAILVIGDACYRGTLKPPEHHLVANLSVFGKCGETGSASTQIHINNWLGTLAVAISILGATLLGQLQFNNNDADGR